ncbi:OmpA family protein [Puniceibacterium sediminis]|uniref:Outer membrane protein OmpA n=1 Tax=Puniceibacterium sediminis TaxID=1608407 RepID=A0A238VVZ8_9RHOB|nr:OmpA family protein [Puniceibacterium sediminis]SNR38480.1 Outer membrane protein OmpA [Puniceibacterium sediminis]
MIRAKFSLMTATAALMALTACTSPGVYNNGAYNDGVDPNAKAKTGAAIGAGVGALAGMIAGNDPKERRNNAIAGAIVGAAGGAIVGNQLDKQEADLRAQMGNNNVTIQNTGDRLIVTLPQDILFATDSASVRPDLQRDLRTVAQNLNAYPNTTVQVIGHTDNTGEAAYNASLSQRRAQSVAGILVAEGVSSSRLRSIGRGEDAPIASNLTPEGRQQNRRVEIVILPNA